MVLLLLQLPDDLLQAILKKMVRRDLCRLRMTAKRVNDLVESMRHKISSRADNKLRMLSFCYSAEHERPVNVVHLSGPDNYCERDLSCGVFNYTFSEEFDVYSQMVKFERGSIQLKDAYRQLSGFGFDAVAVSIGHLNHMIDAERRARDMKKIVLWLQVLKLKCDRLYLGRVPGNFVERVLKLVQFNSLFCNVDEAPGVEEFSAWPVFPCKERHLGMFKQLPVSITPYLQNMTTGSLIFRVGEDPLHLLSNYLLEVHKNRKTRDSLESFSFAAKMSRMGARLKDLTLTGLIKIRTGKQHKRAFLDYPYCQSTLYKYPIDGGVAIILRDNEGLIAYDYSIYFVENDSKEDVFNRMAEKMFSTIPFDFSNFHKKFLSAKNGQKAFDDLYSGYGKTNV